MKKTVSLMLAAAMTAAVISSTVTTVSAADPLPAFPGAEGGGKFATGGRGGTVVHVTNLNDSGAGSLRDAVSHSGRIVVFDVGGTINLKSDISCQGNITVAGQTAPGGKGITLKGGKFAFGGDNTIVRFLASRPGEKGINSDYDAWGGSKGSNSIIDHCSIGWANDEQFGLYASSSQTVQYTIIGPSNCVSYHSKGAHGFGVMFGDNNNTWHHNILAHSLSRNFRGKTSGTNTMDFVNNVIYDWGYQTAYGTLGHLNYVNNYLKAGPSTRKSYNFININSGTAPEKYRFYLTGNKVMNPNGTPYNDALNANNWAGGVDYGETGFDESYYRVDSPFAVSASNGSNQSYVNIAESADSAFEHVISYAGTSINPADNSKSGYNYNSDNTRTKIDAQVLYEARTGTGSLTGGRDFSTVTDDAVINAISTYGIQYCDYNSYYPPAITQKEITDSDNDGMPDEWELQRGLDPNNASDAKGDYLGQGYNNIEYYINDLTVNAFPKGTVTVSPSTTDLGEDYAYSKADADAIKLSPTTIKEASDLTLPQTGSLHGSQITWSSGSNTIVIKNNQISAVNRPSAGNEQVTLTAAVKKGDYTVKRSFTVTVLALATKFDFGNGTAQSGFVKVNAATKYTSGSSSYGFVGTASDMERGAYSVPSGLEALYGDNVQCETTFKTEVPNGKYYVVVHYGCWNDTFGTNYTVEGVNSGNLYSQTAEKFITEANVTDGVLDIEIKKGSKAYGGYIDGLEILTSPPEQSYGFDFGDKDVQAGYIQIKADAKYSTENRGGFTETTNISSMERAPGEIPSGYENIHSDQLDVNGTFRANVPNGKYKVIIHYGSWNTGFGTNYTINGVSSGNLASTTAARYETETNVTAGTLDVTIAKGSKSYGGYINGMDLVRIGDASSPAATPTAKPETTAAPSAEPTVKPVPTPTAEPASTPAAKPTAAPTSKPSKTAAPTTKPTVTPTLAPTPAASAAPAVTSDPVLQPTQQPTAQPSETFAPELTPQPSETPETTQTPSETAAPIPTEAPSPTPNPEQTATPEPEQTQSPEPEQTQSPEPEQTKSPEPERTDEPVIPTDQPTEQDEARIDADVSKADGVYRVTAAPVNCGNGLLIIAAYNENGLAQCRCIPYTGEAVSMEMPDTDKHITIMLWKDFESMIPLCGAKNIEL